MIPSSRISKNTSAHAKRSWQASAQRTRRRRSALEDARIALVDLVGASRKLALAKFTTMRGGIALLRYLSAALMVPGAPRLPIETAFDMQWELAFGSTCKSVADSLTALQTEPAVVDAVAEAIVGALAPAIEDFEMAKRAARAAISAFVDGGVR
jgi:hypothetical protein